MTSETDPPKREVEPITLAETALRHRRVLVLVPLVFALVSVISTLLTPREFVSDFSFMPQRVEGAGGQMSNLAAQFGVNLGSMSEAESPQFYADLIRSRTVLGPLAEHEFEFRSDTGVVSGTAAHLLNIDEGSRARTTEETIRRLRDRLRITPRQETGVVQVEVRTAWPAFSYRLAEGIIDGIHDFNTRVRRSRAQSERTFAATRLEEAQAGLRQAEAELQRFLESNQRGIETSPQLRLQFDRLQRQVTHQQALVTSMMQAYEQARVDEIRNTPVITVVEPPQVPAKGASRGGLLKLIAALLLGLAVAIAVIAFREYLAGVKQRKPGEFETVRDLGRQALNDLRPGRPDWLRPGRRQRPGADPSGEHG